MRDFFKNFRKSESGATLVEYGVALLLAIVLGGGALVALANQTSSTMEDGCAALQAGTTVEENCGDAGTGGTDTGTGTGG